MVVGKAGWRGKEYHSDGFGVDWGLIWGVEAWEKTAAAAVAVVWPIIGALAFLDTHQRSMSIFTACWSMWAHHSVLAVALHGEQAVCDYCTVCLHVCARLPSVSSKPSAVLCTACRCCRGSMRWLTVPSWFRSPTSLLQEAHLYSRARGCRLLVHHTKLQI